MVGRTGSVLGGARLGIFWMVGGAVDFRCGADRLLTHVNEALGRNPLDGSAYVFRNRRGNRIKVLVVDAQGVWLAARRLHEGRFVWTSTQDRLASLTRAQFRWLCAGVDWQRLGAARPLEKRV